MIEDYLSIIDDYKIKLQEIRNVLDRFQLFGKYSEHDKDCALGDIREIVGEREKHD